MSGEEFLQEVRCTAYAAVTGPGVDTGEARWRLNAEAMRQPAETVAAAEAEVSAIAEAAVAEEVSEASAQRASRCAAPVLAGANGGSAG
jgi:hypothetical protein